MRSCSDHSPLITDLKARFEQEAAGGQNSALLVYWHEWGARMAATSVPCGYWPWAIHDDYKAENPDAILAIALDLSRDFNDQVPPHVRTFETLAGFAYQPIIHIPDRTGHIPERHRQQAIESVLKPRPALRLVR